MRRAVTCIGNGSSAVRTHQLHVGLLGGFRVERVGCSQPVTVWQRRTAKTLTKLLATHPRHALHREQILETLWPTVDPASALNSLGKALHAARRALEPELQPRMSSAYLRLTESMLALDPDNVTVDADHFQRLAQSALGRGEVAAYEAALSAYGGELLPEDRYEDWCVERRDVLAGLRLQLLLELATSLEEQGALQASADRLDQVLKGDPTREDVHRRLMVLYRRMGSRDQAIRQFHVCRAVLRRQLGLPPEEATLALYQDVIAEPVAPASRSTPAPEPVAGACERPRDATPGTPCVGREAELAQLRQRLGDAETGRGRLVLLTGEPGVGKTRLAAEFAADAQRRGALVLRGGGGAHGNQLVHGPFAVALEDYVAGRDAADRETLAERHPALAPFVPSLGLSTVVPRVSDRPTADALSFMSGLARLLTELALQRTVVLCIGDLHGLSRRNLELLRYLTQLAVRRRWLIVATSRSEEVRPGSPLSQTIAAATREDLCAQLEVHNLLRADCDRLVAALLGAAVSDGLAQHVHRHTLGNPLFVEELVGLMRERGELVLQHGAWEAAPAGRPCAPARVRDLVGASIAGLDASVRRVLRLIAAAGPRELSLAQLRGAAAALNPPVSEATLFDVLDRALELRVLEERDGSYGFRHPLVRAALYDDLAAHRRMQLHAAMLTGVTAELAAT